MSVKLSHIFRIEQLALYCYSSNVFVMRLEDNFYLRFLQQILYNEQARTNTRFHLQLLTIYGILFDTYAYTHKYSDVLAPSLNWFCNRKFKHLNKYKKCHKKHFVRSKWNVSSQFLLKLISTAYSCSGDWNYSFHCGLNANAQHTIKQYD